MEYSKKEGHWLLALARGLAASDWQRARAAAQDGEGEEVKLQALHVIDGADSR